MYSLDGCSVLKKEKNASSYVRQTNDHIKNKCILSTTEQYLIRIMSCTLQEWLSSLNELYNTMRVKVYGLYSKLISYRQSTK